MSAGGIIAHENKDLDSGAQHRRFLCAILADTCYYTATFFYGRSDMKSHVGSPIMRVFF